jgi:[CysO sulfur-carrier protein]-S-L-cysteine hydrolase
LNISSDIRRLMMEHAQACLPQEACGFLLGSGSEVEKIFPVTNVLHSPTAFRMDPAEQLKVLVWQQEHNLDLLAIYHSHPTGPNYPSARDLAEFAYPGSPYLIVTLGGRQWRVFGFMINGKFFSKLQLHWT